MASRPPSAMVDVVLDEDDESDVGSPVVRLDRPAPPGAPRRQHGRGSRLPTQRSRGAAVTPGAASDGASSSWGSPTGVGPDRVPGTTPDVVPDPVRARTLRVRRRALAVCGAFTVVALAVGAAQGVQDARDARVLSALPGLVEPLDDPLTEAWRVETGGRSWTTSTLLLDSAGDRLVAYELTTGAERWSVPTGWPNDAVEECVGTGDGAAIACRLASGDLMALDARDGGALPGVPTASSNGAGGLPALAGLGGDVVSVTRSEVERIDLRSGDVRWRTALPEGVDPAAVAVADGLVTFSGDVAAVLDGADGTLLGRWQGAERLRGGGGGAAALVRVSGDGFGVWAEARHRFDGPHAAWFDRDGAPVGTVDGHLAEPSATDGSVPAVRLTVTDAPVLRAVAPDGDLLWAARPQDGLPVVRADGAVVLAAADVLRSADLDDGEPRWSLPLGPQDAVTGVSDGRHVLVLRGSGEGRRLVAVALEDGGVAWTVPLAAGLELLPAAASDVVLARDGTAVVGLR